jgi:hypothetical protein
MTLNAAAINQMPLVSLPELTFFILIALFILASMLGGLILVVRLALHIVPKKHLASLFQQIAASGSTNVLLVSGMFLTVLFGIPSFCVAMYDGSSPLEKEYAMRIVTWLLGGWGFGGGVSFISVLLVRKPNADGAQAPEGAAQPQGSA